MSKQTDTQPFYPKVEVLHSVTDDPQDIGVRPKVVGWETIVSLRCNRIDFRGLLSEWKIKKEHLFNLLYSSTQNKTQSGWVRDIMHYHHGVSDGAWRVEATEGLKYDQRSTSVGDIFRFYSEDDVWEDYMVFPVGFRIVKNESSYTSMEKQLLRLWDCAPMEAAMVVEDTDDESRFFELVGQFTLMPLGNAVDVADYIRKVTERHNKEQG